MNILSVLAVLALLILVLACGSGDKALRGYAAPVSPTPAPLVGVALPAGP